MYCLKCGATIPDNTKFCGKCETKIATQKTEKETFVSSQAEIKVANTTNPMGKSPRIVILTLILIVALSFGVYAIGSWISVFPNFSNNSGDLLSTISNLSSGKSDTKSGTEYIYAVRTGENETTFVFHDGVSTKLNDIVKENFCKGIKGFFLNDTNVYYAADGKVSRLADIDMLNSMRKEKVRFAQDIDRISGEIGVSADGSTISIACEAKHIVGNVYLKVTEFFIIRENSVEIIEPSDFPRIFKFSYNGEYAIYSNKYGVYTHHIGDINNDKKLNFNGVDITDNQLNNNLKEANVVGFTDNGKIYVQLYWENTYYLYEIYNGNERELLVSENKFNVIATCKENKQFLLRSSINLYILDTTSSEVTAIYRGETAGSFEIFSDRDENTYTVIADDFKNVLLKDEFYNIYRINEKQNVEIVFDFDKIKHEQNAQLLPILKNNKVYYETYTHKEYTDKFGKLKSDFSEYKLFEVDLLSKNHSAKNVLSFRTDDAYKNPITTPKIIGITNNGIYYIDSGLWYVKLGGKPKLISDSVSYDGYNDVEYGMLNNKCFYAEIKYNKPNDINEFEESLHVSENGGSGKRVESIDVKNIEICEFIGFIEINNFVTFDGEIFYEKYTDNQ